MTIPDEHIPLILKALDTQAALMRATNRDERPYLEIVELLKRKPASKEDGAVVKKRRA